MPEGDSLELAARRLGPVLTGQRLTFAQLRVPALSTLDLTGRTVDEVSAHGKHLLMKIGEHWLHSHLRMDGRWVVVGPASRWPAPGHHVRAVLATDAAQVVGIRLGELDWFDHRSRRRLLDRLGPDPLHDWDPRRVVATLRRTPERPIGPALLDQTVLAGVGTIHRSEALFAVRLHALTPIGRLSDDQLLDLLEAARTSLAASVQRRAVRESRGCPADATRACRSTASSTDPAGCAAPRSCGATWPWPPVRVSG